MLNLVIFFVFVSSASFASMGILLAQRLRRKIGADFLTTHFYFIIFMLTFGAYGLWGQVFIRGLIIELVEAQVGDRISGIVTIFGAPFLIVSWYMLLKMSMEISGTTVRFWFLPFFASINAVTVLLFLWMIKDHSGFQTMELVKYYYLIFNTLYFFIAATMLLLSGKGKKLIQKNRFHMSIGFVLSAIAQAFLLLFYQNNVFLALVFIFVFFSGQLFLPAYLSYIADFKPFKTIIEPSPSFEQFCKHYEISPRESEIILHISKGLTNKDISEKLFITVQTVKDHTHRIYLKTMVRNRTELANLVQKEATKTNH